MENVEMIIEGNSKYFAELDGKIIIGYYIDTIHDIESITTPYVEITEELWLALTANSIRNEFINASDIVYGKIYTINDFDLFQEVDADVIDVPPTPVELAIESLQNEVDDLEALVGDTSVSEQITNAISNNIDTDLTQEGKAADAKAVGDQLSIINQKIDNFDYQSGITSIDDGSGNITLQALYIPLSSSDDNQGNVIITM